MITSWTFSRDVRLLDGQRWDDVTAPRSAGGGGGGGGGTKGVPVHAFTARRSLATRRRCGPAMPS